MGFIRDIELLVHIFLLIFTFTLLGCSSKTRDMRKETVASVGGENITVQDVREMLGVRAAAHKVFNSTAGKKMDALNRIIAGKLLAEEGRRRGFDQTEAFKRKVAEGEKDLFIAALFREQVEGKVEVKEEKIRAEAEKMRKKDETLSEDEAMERASAQLYQYDFRERDNLLVEEVKKAVKVEMNSEEFNRVVSGENVPDESIIAVVDGTPVKYGEVKSKLAGIAWHEKNDISRDPRAIQAILERISIQEGLYKMAKEEEVEKRESYRKLKGNFESSIIIDLVIQNDVRNMVDVTENEINKVYNEHPEMFEKGRKVRARHILVETEETAREIYEKINDSGDFEEMAKKFSKDPSASKGGDLGTFGRGVMVKPFEDVVFSMKVNEISEPVRTQFGYHIIQVTEIEKGKTPPFEDVKGQIEKGLTNRKMNDAIQSLVNSLKDKTVIKINESVLNSV